MVKLPQDFNWTDYILLHDDLKHLNKNQAEFHYIISGSKEKRKYKIGLPKDFNWNTYIMLHDDLKHMNRNQAELHYIKYGKKENRKYINNSNILIYLLYHDDVSYKLVEKYKNYDYIIVVHIETTKYFESIFFKNLLHRKHEWISKDYVGIITCSTERKLSTTLNNIHSKIIYILNI